MEKDTQLPAQRISLDGDWDFTYTRSFSKGEGGYALPAAEQFSVKIPVPGYWDDYKKAMQASDFWADAKFNEEFRHIDFPMGNDMPPDASLPYLVGIGWYKKVIFAPETLADREVYLEIGGVVLEAWVWVNGRLVTHHVGHSTAFEMPVHHLLAIGEDNEIIIAVANTRTDRLGCVIRGFKGFSAGIYRSVSLKIAGKAGIRDCYICPSPTLDEMELQVQLSGRIEAGLCLRWAVENPRTYETVRTGIVSVEKADTAWVVKTEGLKLWSDTCPNLYTIYLQLVKENDIIDTHRQSFGLRRLQRKGVSLMLNGNPVFLRGTTEHAYFPLTCTPPRDIKTYKDNIKKIKELGFNWMRFHTWVPSEEYMAAADQLGMLLQVEAPLGFERAEWVDILHACRKHPSVVIYCCGNEELINEEKIEQLKEMSALRLQLAPDALFNPQEAMRGIEYAFRRNEYERETAARDNLEVPFFHNPKRLAAVREFSDVFGQYPLGLLSYSSVTGDKKTLDERLVIYERPCLSHEIGIIGSYINLDLEKRYEGTRIGSELYASVRKNLRESGLLHRASLYYKNSCAWMHILRKHVIENARKCRYNAGYDLLGVIDFHWHRSGYPCGVMNEFYELKYGESWEEFLEYNGDSVLLLDCPNNRNLWGGEVVSYPLYTALYGQSEPEQGTLFWHVADDSGRIYAKGERSFNSIICGVTEWLTNIEFAAPELEQPMELTIHVRLSIASAEINNHWNLWAFPNTAVSAPEHEENVFVCSELNRDTLEKLYNGSRVLLLGGQDFGTLPTSFQLSIAGRVQGNLATVIEDHPLMNRFPHKGFCDWQFYNMLEGGHAVLFDNASIPFNPIIEMVSSFKLIRKQACLFELQVGRGKLLVCTLQLSESDPAGVYFYKIMEAYAKSHEFNPTVSISPQMMEQWLGEKREIQFDFSTDQALDPNVNKKRK